MHKVRICKEQGCSNLPLFKGNKQLIYCEEHREVGGRRKKEFSTRQKRAIYKKCRGICSVCRTFVPQEDAEYHHIVQLSDGGANSIRNGDLLHRKCHESNYARLHNLDVLKWKAEYIFISDEEFEELLRKSKEVYGDGTRSTSTEI